jgi:putative MATE family efflux protein
MGAQEGSQSLDYASRYLKIILYGAVFMQVGFGLSHCTRAQGFPTITMIGMLLGAVMNTILDPIFIFVFHWGVEGAAWATIISPFCSCLWILSFSLGKKAVIHLRPRALKFSFKIVYGIMSFGSAQFLMQIIASVVFVIFNNILSRTGPAALGVANGGDIALSGYNIVNSIGMLIMMPVFGINQGNQPILGYNYGAKKFDRVLKAYTRAVVVATCVCITGFIVVQSFPVFLIKLFVPDGSGSLLFFAPRAMRIALVTMPINGFQIISANMFVVTGRPKISALLNTLRQCVFLLPCAIIFSGVWGLWGFVAAAPVADTCSFIITGTFILFEVKKLRSLIKGGSL